MVTCQKWANVTEYSIDVICAEGEAGGEAVTMVDGALPTVKAVWDYENLYVLVIVPDDDFYPAIESGSDFWLADNVEVYLDVNENLHGESGPAVPDKGYYQFAPTFLDTIEYDYEWHTLLVLQWAVSIQAIL